MSRLPRSSDSSRQTVARFRDVMTIGVIGHPVCDTIDTADGERRKSFGGICYSLAVFEQLLGEGEKVSPITPVGEDAWEELLSDLAEMPHVETAGLRKSRKPTNRVHLTYETSAKREERLLAVLPPVQYEEICPFFECDALLFNFVSGSDCSLATLKKVRRAYGGLLYMDVHSLTLGVEKDGTRYLRRLSDWRSWLRCADVLQMNEDEAVTFVDGELDESALQDLLQRIVGFGARAVNVTLGSRGSYICYREREEVMFLKLPGSPAVEAVDPTGCGDAFSAAFVVEYIRNGGAVCAAKFANEMAGMVAATRGVKAILEFRLEGLPDGRQSATLPVSALFGG